MAIIKLKRNETFYIREGWFEKAINTINEKNINIFYKNDGIEHLGIGSNMVKGLKYWLKTANIIKYPNCDLTEFAQLLFKYDRYLDDEFSWFFIHYFLATNQEDNPIANEVFNSRFSSFSKSDMVDYLMTQFKEKDENVNRKYVDADFGIFLKSYVNEDVDNNPEENYICPLSRLKLLSKNKDEIKKLKPAYSSLSYLVIYYSLLISYEGKPFEIEESIELYNSPIRIFNLDKYMYLQYLDEMRKNGLVTINRAAGLNTVYFEKQLSLNHIFEEQYGGSENV